MKALTIEMQHSFQETVAQAMAQSFQNNNAMELMPITQPDYESKKLNTINDHVQFFNTNGTTNNTIISPTNLKRP